MTKCLPLLIGKKPKLIKAVVVENKKMEIL